MTKLFALALALASVAPARAAGSALLTVGKVARFVHRDDPDRNGGVVTVGRDAALATLHDPRCPQTSAVLVEAYLQSTFRDSPLVSANPGMLAPLALDCGRWRAARRGFVYEFPAGPVRAIRYASGGLRIAVGGAAFTPIGGPVGFLDARLTIGDDSLRVRVHNFRRNDAAAVISRKPSASAAAGEAGFWRVLLDEDASAAGYRATVASLEKAARRDARDGRSRFLLAMLHLYRFGQEVTDLTAAGEAARAELRAANAWFAKATPLLWNDATATGDSRVPGFAAAGQYVQGVVEGDSALRSAGLAALARAVEVNAFFNVFDYVPVVQAARAADPEFQAAFGRVTSYLNDPETLACVATQPEICSNAGLAPHNIQGSLVLFGDIYAKAGDLAHAQTWYGLVSVFPDTKTWPFAAIAADRRAHAATRVALYQDADPSNDPPIIGMGQEACAVCHRR